MKRFLLLLTFILPSLVFSQRLGYVDSQQILESVPEYREAQVELERLSKQWEGEISSMLDDMAALQGQLNAEKVLLTTDMVAQRQLYIDGMQDSSMALQQAYFGPEGQLFAKRLELVAPVQAMVASAIVEVARKKKLDFMFDKGSGIAVVYARESNDYSQDVLKQLGY